MTSRLLHDETPVRAGRVGAWYDLVVTVGFATPWTAAALLDLMRTVHRAADLPGEPLPAFEGPHLLFVTLFGAAVTMWSIARALRPVPWMIALDTAGRVVFSLAFVGMLTGGHSWVVMPFLALEVAFLVAQAVGVRAVMRQGASTIVAPPASVATVR